ncbi:MAG: hypothetical protein SFU91_09830 [Chloroherpetonaceae bacterium]|nr:hypothetical protein [Chloroherpetonaceae bacterium]
MRKQDILQELEDASRKLGYKVRYEKGSFVGGDCRVHEDNILVVNKFIPIEGKIATIARALVRIGVEGIFLSPQARKAVDEEISKTRPETPESFEY